MSWVTAFLDLPVAHFDAGAEFWCALTGSRLSARRGAESEFATLLPPSGGAYLRVQAVGGSGGVHVDLHIGDRADRPAWAARAVELGATVLRDARLRSPGGLDFCLSAEGPSSGFPSQRPPPNRWSAGQRSLVDQVCLDIAPDAFESEADFWAALTGWERRHGPRLEFDHLARPSGLPIRLLLQRLDNPDDSIDDGRRVRAHVDLACDDVEAEVSRHTALGAQVVRRMPAWATLRDPAGLAYCITSRDPATGTLPS